MPDYIGQSMGRYHILEQLGEGGMATVFKAYDTRLERDAAVKIIRRGAFPPDLLEIILKRFEREAKALARLTHPNIVSVIDYGDQDGTPYLVMAYLPGGTLKQRLGKPMPWQEAIRLLLPIARALQFAHSQKIVHRDVKPSNILISLSGEPMLTDFGIAKILEGAEGQTLTGTGVGVGTPEYMAPEQWTGQASPLSDLYSLGVVLYELVTGHKPYEADTPAAVLIKQINDPLPRPIQYISDLPDAVEKMLIKALSKRPEDRHQDMTAMIVAMEGLLTGGAPFASPEAARPVTVEATRIAVPSVQETAREKTPPAVPTIREAPPSRPPARKVKFLPFGIGAIVLLVLICGIVGVNYLVKNWPLVAIPISTSTPTLAPSPSPTVQVLDPGSLYKRVEDGMVMVYVPAGEFSMGTNSGEDDERPVHSVVLDAFWIDQTEVTNGMYAMCVDAGKCSPPSSIESQNRPSYYGNSAFAEYPVVHVSWNAATAYCAWAGGRLPTEAEWEKAARGTDGRIYPWGNQSPSGTLLNFNGNLDDTSRVGNYSAGASPYGVLDMAGNVWEWVSDFYDKDYYRNSTKNNPPGALAGLSHVLRGGAYYQDMSGIRSTDRYMGAPTVAYSFIGFRCARTP